MARTVYDAAEIWASPTRTSCASCTASLPNVRFRTDSPRAAPGTTTGAAGAPAAITLKTTLPVRQFLTSGDAEQQVRDDGSFRELFVMAIRGDERADVNDDCSVTGDELGLFLSQRMAALTQAVQTPRYGKLHRRQVRPGRLRLRPAPGRGGFDGAATDARRRFLPGPPEEGAGIAGRLEALAGLDAGGVFPKTFKDCAQCPEMVVIPAGSFRMGDLTGTFKHNVFAPVPFPRPVRRVSFSALRGEPL